MAPNDPKAVPLDGFSIAELTELRDRIDSRISNLEKQREEDALKKLEALASELGLTRDQIAERFRKKASKKTRSAALAPKFRNPKNPAESWAGRGKKPAWVEAHLKAGGKLEDLAI